MPALLRQRAVVLWAVLVAATLLSWQLGSDAGTGGRRTSALVILTIACMKVRFIGLDFMELRQAPLALRAAFEVYVALLLVLLTVLCLLA